MVVAVGAVLLLPDGRWVLQRRTDDAPTDPNGLSFFGGHLDPGETPEQAILRELAEETDIELTEKQYPILCEPITVQRNNQPFKLHVYKIGITSMDFKVFEGKWAEAHTIDELRERTDTSDVLRAVLQSVAEK